MIINLKLENIRLHDSYELTLGKTNILIGKNGVGKTSILEALALLSWGRSFRCDDKRNLIKSDKAYGRVTADELEVFVQKEPRLLLKVKERGVPKRLTDFVGKIKVVAFSPETLNIITGAPAERRRFLDIMISEVSKRYLKSLSEYTKVRRQRNSLIGRINAGQASEEELVFWDGELVRYGNEIVAERLSAVKFINEKIGDLYKEISGKKEERLQLFYHNKAGDDFAQKLRDSRPRDLAYGATIYGPHRDDLEFRLNNMEMSEFASRGEIRSAILALKVCELNYLEFSMKNSTNYFGEYADPILLLDDIFSEFDEDRREHLGRLILNYQSLITTTDRSHLSSDLLKNAEVIEIVR